MSDKNFTQGEWYLGNSFRHEDSKSEWCNLYADGEGINIAIVLLNDGCGKTYHNATLIEAAPEMYRILDKCQSCTQHFLDGRWDDAVAGETENLLIEIQAVLKKVRGENKKED